MKTCKSLNTTTTRNGINATTTYEAKTVYFQVRLLVIDTSYQLCIP